MNNVPIVANVETFLKKASLDHGRIRARQFDDAMYQEIVDNGITSPIEQLFYIAVHGMCASLWLTVNPEPSFDNQGTSRIGFGVFVQPQAKIGKYRVDFLISQNGNGPDDIYTPIVIELDGHEFHDKDKRQRSYEKERDRFLVKSGYKVLHFTGSDVVKDPYKVAFEALDLVGAFVGAGFEEYDPKNPLGEE